MMRRLILGTTLLAMAACARVDEEVVIVEPIMEEPSVEAIKRTPCPAESDDGIGGTGCSPD